MTHILITKSHRFPHLVEPALEGWHYDREQGIWCVVTDEQNDNAEPKPRPRLSSKKADLETGEDMKGP